MRQVFDLAFVIGLQAYAPGQEDDYTSKVNSILADLKHNEMPDWTYSELASAADMIVVATLVEKRVAATDIVGKTDFDRKNIQRISNSLKVLSVFKGASKKQVDVITTQWGPNTVALGLKTNFAVLRSRQQVSDLCAVEVDGQIVGLAPIQHRAQREIIPEYLIYLKHSGQDDDHFVPVTGQRWAGLSVRMLND
ncbi:MAG: hypothetical protein AAF483_16415 [Planctomycetota bacterium]